MSRIIAPQWVNRRKRGSGREHREARRLHRELLTPRQIDGLYLYVDARKTLFSDTDSVSEWKDLSGHGHHLSQATGAKQPTFNVADINSLPAVEFDGSDDVLVNTDFASEFDGAPAEPMTFAAVVQLTATGGDEYLWGLSDTGDDQTLYHLHEADTDTWEMIARPDGESGNAKVVGPSTDTNPHVIVGALGAAGGVILRIDGPSSTRIGGSNSLPANSTWTFNTFAVGLLKRSSEGNAKDFSLGMLAIWRRLLSDAEMDDVESYMGDAYGITIS